MTTLLGRAADIWDTQTGQTVFADLGYTPTDRQAEFHAASEFDVLFGGAAGGGKTRALVLDDIRDAIRYPGLTIGAFRRSYPELEESLLAELRLLLPDLRDLYGARYDETKHDLRFGNGSLIRFRHAKNAMDATKRQGGQYQKLTFDERTLMPPGVVQFLYSRLRSGRADLPVLGVRSGTNPGGIGHGHVKQTYIDATDHGARVITDQRGRTVRFIQSKLADNPHINAEYAQDLEALPDAMRRAFLDGDWNSFTGQVFTEWRHDRHVVPTRPLPETWRRFCGIDWGFGAPWAAVWFAVDPDGRVWVYRQLYEAGVGEREQARRIITAERTATGGREDVVRIGDTSMWDRRGDAASIASIYADEGVTMLPADKGPGSRLQRKVVLHDYLADAPACLDHRAQGLTVCPRMHVMDVCAPLIRNLPALPYDPTRIEDVDSNADDHDYDALTYALARWAGTRQASPHANDDQPVRPVVRARRDSARAAIF